MSDKRANNGIGPGWIEIEGERYATFGFMVGDALHVVRELSVDETDDAAEAATGPDGKLSPRLNTRLLLAKAMVEPATDLAGIGKFGNQKFSQVLRAYNNLNSLPAENPTAPAGSAGPTSPAGGEPSPTS